MSDPIKLTIIGGVNKDGTKELVDRVEINPGDFVTFPESLSCTWDISETVRKVYQFK